MRRPSLPTTPCWVSAVIATAALLGFALLARAGENLIGGEANQIAIPANAGAAFKRLPATPEKPSTQALVPVTVDQARALNASAPFAGGALLPARPFKFAGASLDRKRARECLALAAMAEAGGSDRGQRAVMQVVLNRVRHPAFVNTICGVVFQGSRRATGCQFTFTCDGSLARSYSQAAWTEARRRADRALDGAVDGDVGTATHYHADYVLPVWSPQLEKLARVEAHLFFRWPGYWGSRDAARIAYRGAEPDIAALTARAAVKNDGDSLAPTDGSADNPSGSTDDDVGIGNVIIRHPDGGAFMVHLKRVLPADAALRMGRRLCGGHGYCQVLAWTDRAAIPKGYPVPPSARIKLSFSYVLDASSAEIVLYDCKVFKATPRERCIPPPLS